MQAEHRRRPASCRVIGSAAGSLLGAPIPRVTSCWNLLPVPKVRGETHEPQDRRLIPLAAATGVVGFSSSARRGMFEQSRQCSQLVDTSGCSVRPAQVRAGSGTHEQTCNAFVVNRGWHDADGAMQLELLGLIDVHLLR